MPVHRIAYGQTGLCLLILLSFTFTISTSQAELIDSVRIDAPVELASKMSSSSVNTDQSISWSLLESGKVTVLICDLNGNIVRTLIKKEEQGSGHHSLIWDGLDEFGSPLPASIYFPIIRIKSRARGTESYNPTAHPWGEMISIADAHYDSDSKLIRYSTETLSVCRIRISGGDLDNDLFYRSISDWKLIPPGNHEEPWDGMDSSNIVNVASEKKYSIFIEAFSLPPNTVMLGDTTVRPSNTKGIYKTYPIHPPHGSKAILFPINTKSLLSDFSVTVGFANAKKNKNSASIVKGKSLLTIDLPREILPVKVANNNLRLFVYLDGKIIHKSSGEELPIQFELDTLQFSNKEHIVTVNVKMPDYRAAASVKILIAN